MPRPTLIPPMGDTTADELLEMMLQQPKPQPKPQSDEQHQGEWSRFGCGHPTQR